MLIARGLTNKQIAQELVIAEGTVAIHVGNVLGKLQTCIGGGDTELQIDPTNGKIFFSDLQGLTNFSNSTSEDGGRTWTTSCTAVEG